MSSLREQRAKIINYVIVGVGLALIPISILVVLGALKDGWTIGATMQLAAFGIIWLFALNSKLASLQLRGAVIIGFLFLTALSEVYRVGMVTATFPILAVLPILGTVVGGMRVGLMSIGIVAVSLIAVAILTITGERVPAIVMPDYVLNPSEWSVRIINVVVAAGIGVFTAGTLYRFHAGSIGALKKQNTELGKTQARIAQSVKLARLGYAITDMRAGKVCQCDDRFAEMHGMNSEKFVSLDLRSDILERVIHEGDRDEARQNYERLLNGEALIAVFRHVMPDGQIKNIRKIFSPLDPDDPKDHRFEVVAQDVTQAVLCLWLSQGCLVQCLPGPWFSPRSGITLPPDGVRS